MKERHPVNSLYARFLIVASVMLATAATVRASYQSTILGDNPLAFYALNPGVDGTSTAPDLTGNGNDGLAFNIAVANGPTAFITNAANFGFTNSASIDLSLASNPGLLNFSGPITMEAWVQPRTPTVGSGPPANILGKGYDPSQSDNELVLRAQGGIYYGGTFSDTNSGNAFGGVQTTNWAYVVATYDGTNWNLYVNTKKVGQGADSVGAINFVDDWEIGSGSISGQNRYFDGNISEVALYSSALTPSQVLNHYFVGELNSSPSTSKPIIITQPQSQTAFVGGTVTFTVEAVSGLATTNQWFKNGAPLTGKTNASLTLSGVSGSDAVNYSVTVGNSVGTTNSATVSLTLLASGNPLKWSPNANTGIWDTTNSANWINLNNSQQVVFNTNDQVLFDDTVGVPTSVTVNGPVSPSVITVNSSTNAFTIGGSGTITGAGSLIKQGSSVLTIVSPGNFTGPVTINGGSIYAGNNSFHSVSSITITNNSTWDFGGGGYNSSQPVLVSGTGVNGLGALFNSFDDFPSETLAITLAGDTTFGGTNRWDLFGSITGPHKVTINWTDVPDGNYGEWNTVAIATNVGDIELASGKLGVKSMGSTMGNPAANFIVDANTELDFWSGDNGYTKNFHVLGNGKLQLLSSFANFNGNVILEDNANFVGLFSGGGYTVTGPVALNGVAHLTVGDGNMTITNVISGPGGFVWDAYNHQLFLQASNTYSGVTAIAGGLSVVLSGNGSISHSTPIFFGGTDSTSVHVDATGRTDQTLTLASGQTLGGIGAITGNLTASPGSTVAPAGTNTAISITVGSNPIGAISASGNVALSGTTVLKLNGNGNNDMVQAGGSINYGGTLKLVNISGAPFSVGDSFHIFSAASYNGSFTNGLVPATPGSGLAWDTTQLSSGTLAVIAGAPQPVFNSATISGGNFILGGTNGTFGSNYVVLTATNLTTSLTNWTPLITNGFDNTGGFHFTNPVTTSPAQHFFILKLQ